MDKNTTIGLFLMMALVFVYMTFFAPDPKETITPQTVSTTVAKEVEKKVAQSNAILDSNIINEESKKLGKLAKGYAGKSEKVVIENELVKLTIDSKGALINQVILKNFKEYNQKPLVLADSLSSKISLQIPTSSGIIDLSNLYYEVSSSNNKAELKVSYSSDEYIVHEFSIQPNSYEVKYNFRSTLKDNFIQNKNATLLYEGYATRTEKDLSQSRIASSINYYTENDGHNNLSDASLSEEKESLEKVKWLSFKSRFFNIGIIPSHSFAKAEISQVANEKDTIAIKNFKSKVEIDANEINNLSYKFYFGPNDLDILNKVTDNYAENLNMGWPVIRQINRYLIFPVFKLVSSLISNYGLIILLVVVILKLVLLPLSYKSYMSMAKMRVLKPEMDEIKERCGDDMTKSQQETMKLYQEVGVNPLSGCIPMLLSAPFLIAMFSFFPNLIDLRQQSFLWAHDLSTYDSVFTLPFALPAYGSHVSLFTILMTLSTLAYTWMNNQVSTVQGPMKAMSYIMPLMFTFVLNSYASGLTYYYLVSNVVTMLQQTAIKGFVDEKKIRAKLDENKKKFATGDGNGSKKSGGFMNRLQEAMKVQEELKRSQQGKK